MTFLGTCSHCSQSIELLLLRPKANCPGCGKSLMVNSGAAQDFSSAENQTPIELVRMPASERAEAERASPRTRPWVRYWARLIDLALWSCLLDIVFEAKLIQFPPGFFGGARGLAYMLLSISLMAVLWLPLEALFLCCFGATPGKAVLRTRVTGTDGKNLSYGKALRRATWVLLRGRALWVVPLNFCMECFSYRDLMRNHSTPWDRCLQSQVTHQRIGLQRIVLGLGLYALLWWALPQAIDACFED